MPKRGKSDEDCASFPRLGDEGVSGTSNAARIDPVAAVEEEVDLRDSAVVGGDDLDRESTGERGRRRREPWG